MANYPATHTRIDVSVWDLRRLYNEGDIKRLARKGEYDVKIKHGKPRIATSRIRTSSKSVNTRYFDRNTGVQIAKFHHYEALNGDHITKLDPKFLLIDGIEYHLPAQGTPEPRRLNNSEINDILKKHGLRAGITYLYSYSERAKRLWKQQVRDRLVKFGMLESRDWVLVLAA